MPVPSNPQDLIDLIREKLFNNTSGLIDEPSLREVLENIVKVLGSSEDLTVVSLEPPSGIAVDGQQWIQYEV